ncbi:MAG: Holliday junction branch migration protein RuvA [Oscillospiraceae bacterium]|jgi:Holliday junction DNA helicase RuvA|nr:Holliday junction branch migration protein RuvA [Oscillospiraceae bacterium]
MFYHLRGEITHIEPQLAVVDCNGVGYAVHTSSRTLAQLNIGDIKKLLTYVQITETSTDIFGFLEQLELYMFKLLLSVNGVGTKSALAALSTSSPEELAGAITAGDEALLVSTPGIGKKSAQRIILELRDKIAAVFGDTFTDDNSGGVSVGSALNKKTLVEVRAALEVLGYSPNEIAAAMKSLPPNVKADWEPGEIVKLILKK